MMNVYITLLAHACAGLLVRLAMTNLLYIEKMELPPGCSFCAHAVPDVLLITFTH